MYIASRGDTLTHSRRVRVRLTGWLSVAFLSSCVAAQTGPPTSTPATGVTCPAPAPYRVTMQALHQAGGVPLGWRFTPPQGDVGAGRKLFVDYGCHSCHTIQGETFPNVDPEQSGAGPDLTGMGSHHPAEYFAEAILNPDAVLVEGPGYVSEGGRSAMPSYDDMSLKQLADLVAYLKSLSLPGDPATARCIASRPPQPTSVTTGAIRPFGYVAQAYEVADRRLEDFYRWFDRREFRRYDGLVSIETYASRLRGGRHELLCLFGFDSEAALVRFSDDIKKAKPQPGDFVHPTRSYRLQSPPLYLAPQMSVH